MKLLTIGVALVTDAVAGCSSTTSGPAGAIQDDVASAAPASAGAATSASPPASTAAAHETGAEMDVNGDKPGVGDLGAVAFNLMVICGPLLWLILDQRELMSCLVRRSSRSA